MKVQRGKAKYKKDLVTKDVYKYYKEHSKDPLSYKEWYNFLYGSTRKSNGFIKLLTDEIIHNSYILNLPLGGRLFIRKEKPKIKFKESGDLDFDRSKIYPDWGTTRELWEKDPEAKKNKTICYYYNKHTRGFQYKFFWDKHNIGNLKNKFFYKFTPARSISRELAKVLKENPNIDYYLK